MTPILKVVDAMSDDALESVIDVKWFITSSSCTSKKEITILKIKVSQTKIEKCEKEFIICTHKFLVLLTNF